MSDDILKKFKEKMSNAVEHTRNEMMHIRTGKASPNLLDNIKVEYYGNPTPLRQIANVTAPEARLLVVQPFDKNALKDIEKAIMTSDLGLNPQNDGNIIRIPIPMLTSERREELIKIVKRFAEEGRISVRNARREANEFVKREEKASNISEDESHRLQDVIQKETDKYVENIDKFLEKREAEIREE